MVASSLQHKATPSSFTYDVTAAAKGPALPVYTPETPYDAMPGKGAPAAAVEFLFFYSGN